MDKERGALLQSASLMGTLLKCMGVPVILAVAIIFVFMINTDDPNEFIRMSGFSNRRVSSEVSAKIIEDETAYKNATEDTAKRNNEEWSDATFDPSKHSSSTRSLSAERFSMENGYIEHYKEINECLLAYASANGSFTVGGQSFDGIAFLAMCNDESYSWLRDDRQTISSAFPSKLINVDVQNYVGQIEKLNIGTVFTSGKAYGLSGNFRFGSAWMAQDYGKWVDSDQGPTTSAFTASDHDAVLSGAKNEITIVSELKSEIDAISQNKNVSEQIIKTGTGSNQVYWLSTIANYGDRWNIADNAKVFKHNMETYLPKYAENYKAMFNEDVGKYHYICFMQMQHWYGSAYNAFNSTLDGNFGKAGAWPLLIKGLCNNSSLAIIQSWVDSDLASVKNGQMVGQLCHSKMITEVLANVDSLGLTYADGTKFNSATDCVKPQAKNECIGFLYNYMLLETLFSEGGASS